MKIEEVLQIKEQMLGDYSVQAVSARSLHKALELEKDYTTWIGKRIQALGLLEGEDFHLEVGKLPSGRKAVYHVIPIQWAKKIAMTSNSLVGDKVREYFLACEKTVQSNVQSLIATTNNHWRIAA